MLKRNMNTATFSNDGEKEHLVRFTGIFSGRYPLGVDRHKHGNPRADFADEKNGENSFKLFSISKLMLKM